MADPLTLAILQGTLIQWGHRACPWGAVFVDLRWRFATIVETVYDVPMCLSPECNVYMGIQQAINSAIRRQFDAEGIQVAFPTKTLYFRRESGSAEMPTSANAEDVGGDIAGEG